MHACSREPRVCALLGWRDDDTQDEAGGTDDPFGVGTQRSVGGVNGTLGGCWQAQPPGGPPSVGLGDS